MANLVPQLAKKRIAFEYWVRVLTAWFLLWAVAFVIGGVLLFPVYIFTKTQVAVHAESASAAEESVVDYETVSAELKQANIQAQLVIEDARKTRASDYVSLFNSLEGQGVVITELNFSKNKTIVEPIRLTGIATDREALAAFRERLLAPPAIATVNLPISSLAKESDITFNMTISMVKNASL